MPWNPSQPAITSQSSRCSSPSCVEAHVWLVTVEVVHAYVRHLEEKRQPSGDPCGDEVLHDLGLPVDDDGAPSGQLAERHTVALAVELKIDASMDDPFASKPIDDAGAIEELNRSLLEHTGADARLNMLTASIFEHHRVDARAPQERGQRQAGGAGSDDRDLGAQPSHLSSSTS